MPEKKINQCVYIKPKNPEKRPEITNETTHIEYFEELMFDRVNLCPLPKIESLNIVIEFEIIGHNAGSWTIVVEYGILKRVLRNYFGFNTFDENKAAFSVPPRDNPVPLSDEAVLKPTCTFNLDGITFMSIVRREITPQQAFFQKKVRIEGDMMLALKMNVLVNYM